MARLICTVLIITITMLCFALPRGTTQQEFPAEGQVTGQAPVYYPSAATGSNSPQNTLNRNEWIADDSLHLNTIIRAGNQYGMIFDANTQSMQLCTSMGDLTAEAVAAIHKSPVWMQADLQNVLCQLTSAKQQAWSAIINDAMDPYIDEIAFSVAHSSVQYLASALSEPALFVENALLLYSIDAELSYVQIVNHGNSLSDPDYYSTTSYYKTTADSQIVQMQVPRDIYYWYIVHPKLTDEIPAYINPTATESNASHSNNITTPESGEFWRSYLYSVEDETYPSLRDTLMQCQTVFNRNANVNDAIHAIQWWINHTMAFNSNSERPHQPVRIYKKHFGRCGEYADYTSAVSRIALIPCTSILSASTDHTWNEFWEDGWVQWEPVNGYINNPLVYEDGWGKVFGSVFEIRSDGFLSSVTDRYSTGLASITIAVKDSMDNPIDGARVIMAINEGGIIFDMVKFTDNNGIVVFPVGENRHYYARVESVAGICPSTPGAYMTLVDNSVNGEQYSFQMIINHIKPLPQILELPIPIDNTEDWRFAIQFSVPAQVMYGRVTWDDLNGNGSQPYFYNTINQTGKINVLMTDADNYLFYNMGHFGEAFNIQTEVQAGTALFNIPNDNIWYSFLDNSSHVANAQLVSGAMLYQRYGVANDDDVIPRVNVMLYPAYPNPFVQDTAIRFNLPKAQKAELSIYNTKGQKVKTLISSNPKAGISKAVWNGKDDNDQTVANGIYYYRLTAGSQTVTRKLVLLK